MTYNKYQLIWLALKVLAILGALAAFVVITYIDHVLLYSELTNWSYVLPIIVIIVFIGLSIRGDES